MLFADRHQSTLSNKPCTTQDCHFQLLFPVLSLSEAPNDQSWPSAAGQRSVTSSMQVWTAAADDNDGNGDDVWPAVALQKPVNMINNNDSDKNIRTSKDDRPANSDNDQLQYHDDTSHDKHNQMTISTIDFQGRNSWFRPTGKFRVVLM